MFTCVCHFGPIVKEISDDALRISVALHLLDVGTSGECFLASRNNNGTDRRVCFELCQCNAQFRHQLLAQRIERLGTVESDQADVLLLASNFLLDHLKLGALKCRIKVQKS